MLQFPARTIKKSSTKKHVTDAAEVTRTLARYVVDAKFQALVAPVLPNDRIGELIGLSWNAENLGDIGVIARAAAQRSESGL